MQRRSLQASSQRAERVFGAERLKRDDLAGDELAEKFRQLVHGLCDKVVATPDGLRKRSIKISQRHTLTVMTKPLEMIDPGRVSDESNAYLSRLTESPAAAHAVSLVTRPLLPGNRLELPAGLYWVEDNYFIDPITTGQRLTRQRSYLARWALHDLTPLAEQVPATQLEARTAIANIETYELDERLARIPHPPGSGQGMMQGS